MPHKRYKDRSRLIAERALRSLRAPYYVQVYLWGDAEAFHANSVGNDGDCIGCFCPAPWTEIITTEDDESGTVPAGTEIAELRQVAPRLGELHLVANTWTTEVVSHELCHALMHRMRVLTPSAQDVMDQARTGIERRAGGSAEEEVAYELGRWVSILYRWLWDMNPYGEHATSDA